jgi:hypothetical protein
METLGIAMGICVFHFLLPLAFYISVPIYVGILLLSACEGITLFLIWREGYFNFSKLRKIDKESITKPITIQKVMFYLIILAQFFKSIFVIIGTYFIFDIAGLMGPVSWLFNVPIVPILIVLAGVDSVVVLGLFLGKEWAFHTTIMMAVVGFVETLYAWTPMIVLISVWIITLVLPCWGKDGFYLRYLGIQ